MENYPEGEIEEMINIYVEKGFSREEASTIMHTMTKKPEYKEYFLHHMVRGNPLFQCAENHPWRLIHSLIRVYIFCGGERRRVNSE